MCRFAGLHESGAARRCSLPAAEVQRARTMGPYLEPRLVHEDGEGRAVAGVRGVKVGLHRAMAAGSI